MNIQMLKDYFQEFIDDKQHKIMFLNKKKDMFEEFKVIDAINLLEEKDKEIERLNNIIKEVREMLYKRDKDDYDIYTANVLCDIQSDFEEILRGEY